MSADSLNGDGNEGIETYQAREIVRDEDVLSYPLLAALEQVGSATGFVLAFALLCALLPRAGRMLAASAASSRTEKSEDREVRAIERRAHEEGARDAVSIGGADE